MIIRQTQPDNLESVFNELDGQWTPNAAFYIRDHFPVPALDPETWRLRVEGSVDHPFEISLAELRSMPATTYGCVLECAGNSRVFLVPKRDGVQWELGAVGCAQWTGVPLSAILDRAGVRESAVEVVLEGADRGEAEKSSRPKDEIAYSHSLPLEKARRPEVLLAYEMNGAPLPRPHGFPVRAVVPGWYAMCSVKWLQRILVVDRPFQGYFKTVEYAYWTSNDGIPQERLPLSEMALKSEIARPAIRESLPMGRPYRVYGAAWGPDSRIAKVEVSVDGGDTWQDAKLLGESIDHGWRLWEFWWTPERPGQHTVLSRATDAEGTMQPAEHDLNHEGYVVHHTLPIQVDVG